MRSPFPVPMVPLTIKTWQKKLPNWLTIYRIFIAVPTIIFLGLNHLLGSVASFTVLGNVTIHLQVSLFIGGVLFITAVISDYLDGYWARKWRVVSNFGKLWDPLADKVIINGVLIVLVAYGYFHFSFLIVIVLRDLVLDGLRFYAQEKQLIIPANQWGKWKTTWQMIAILMSCFVFSFSLKETNSANTKIFYWAIVHLPYYLATAFSLVSFGIYAQQIYKTIKVKVKL
ncbi:CDP-diacylglycerol--glycerol-3-phosphate 3-phosphatidyltransferase [Mycoplasmoides pneumoniae]|uniref:CDP-diacylglycerol--glycerol-3-phosphate 3-phosphatidyltransferase n=3 Tax=Mycoplasmoides pneumoniae TaxID=2104 RepID=A0AB38W971_MYCPM|nr:CDP-diacylglycerol--glycerol-3-phosphate 3-phosphatidyltransferase [Mycoplasmoides pneumoniae]QHR08444.1 CDP-diacylglycerol--glycerol-3-phosphate 3-phosphatidyltransferase [Mycoplasmoides pneumoniae]QHR10544.1 CDP-diacylglycerol--glycerol-3-phosphate 3-phosphatidyltransferase [Mycoplasmoides pneumoniae]QHR12919.1 CDP-diacylglycerol--glycerol-3-phosphate 3-phosphatidyltransferase [Mycoplasmoides pneumoniae]QHR14744.1 CDP-diacylglycerol--glycerol-3-phosphate 3-phosphatidyltransferase [Mycoplas